MPHRRAPRAAIVARNLCYVHPDGSPLLHPMSFSLTAGRYGLVGSNGIGKSTLLRLIAGELTVTGGSLQVTGQTGYLAQRDELAETRARSGGEGMRERLAPLFARRPSWLLLDEPTNHLDAGARHELYRSIDGWRGGIVIAGHDAELLERVDAIVELSVLGARLYGGPFSFYLAQRRLEEAAAARAIAGAQAELDRERRDLAVSLERASRGNARGKARAARENIPKMARGAMQRHAQVTAGKRSDIAERRIRDAESAVAGALARARREPRIVLDLPATAVHATKRVAACTSGGTWFEIVGPERIGVTGPNGSGKSTLLRAIEAGARVRTAHLDQHLSFLPDEMTLVEAMREAAPQLAEHERRVRLGRLLFEQERALEPIAHLSGGERVRAALALRLWSADPPMLLLLDEPANGLDARGTVHLVEALQHFKGAIVAVSHDRALLEALGVGREIALTQR